MRKFAAISLAGIMAFGALPVMAEDREMARKRAGGKAASYHEHETTLNHKTSHRP